MTDRPDEPLVLLLDSEARIRLQSASCGTVLHARDENAPRFWDLCATPHDRHVLQDLWVQLEHDPRRVCTGILAADGTTRTIDWCLTPLFAADDALEAVIAESVPRDEAAQLRSKLDSALANEERLRTLIEAMPDPVFLKDGRGRWVEVNRAALDAFQVEGDYHGKTDRELAETSARMRNEFLYCATTDEEAWHHVGISHSEEVLPRRDGTHRTYDTHKVPLFYPDGSRKGLVVLGRDITDKKRADRILTASERQLRAILSTTLDAIMLIDHEGKITFLNRAAEEMLGAPSSEAVGAKWNEGPWTFTLPTGRAGVELPISEVAQSRRPVRGIEVVVIRADGTRMIASMNAAPLDEPAGAIVVAAQDITSRAELVALKSAFLQIASHELRTPLTPLRLLLRQTAARLARDEPIEPAVVTRMQRQTDRLTALVNELVDLVRLEHGVLPLNLKVADVDALVKGVVEEYRSEAKGREINFTGPTDVNARADVDPTRIEQVVGSLIDNAIKYSDGPIDVRVDALRGYVHICVLDRGPGIPPEDRGAIFSRFFRVGSAEVDRHAGLGLGLALSRETIRQHHGELTYAPREGGGSIFTIILARV